MSSLLLLVLLLLPLGLLFADGNWRGSLLYSVVIGFLRDPLRKLTPDQPALFVGLSLLGLLAGALILIQRVGGVNLSRLFSGYRWLIPLIQALAGLVALQSLVSLLNGRPLFVVGIGIGFYAAPLIAAWCGYYLALAPRNVIRFLRLFVGMSLLFTISILAAYSGYQSPLFAEVGLGMQIHVSELGAYVQGLCGLWRSSELAAWSLGAACCFLMILAISSRNPTVITTFSVLMVALLVISTLTGRRKVVVLVAGFLAFYALLLAWRGDSRSKYSVLIGGGTAGVLLLLLSFSLEESLGSSSLGVFVRRTGGVWDQLATRWQSLGVNVIGAALTDGGLLGAGVGATAQGARTLGLETGLSSWAAEGGLGKITLELGLPGILLVLLISLNLVILFGRIITGLQQAAPAYRLLNIGLIAFLASNIPNFAVASQVYGDPFVLSVLGLSAGFVLAAPAVLTSLPSGVMAPAAPQAALVRS